MGVVGLVRGMDLFGATVDRRKANTATMESPFPPRLLLWTHVGATLALVGLVWTVQLVQYPLFAKVGHEAFSAYHAGHSTRISLVVVPLMLAELGTAILLLWLAPAAIPGWSRAAGLALVGAIWLSTFLVQVPLHEVLGRELDPLAHRRLVDSNWLRTVAWTLRGGLVLWMAEKVAAAPSTDLVP